MTNKQIEILSDVIREKEYRGYIAFLKNVHNKKIDSDLKNDLEDLLKKIESEIKDLNTKNSLKTNLISIAKKISLSMEIGS
ncbi:MAG: hypothetical protein Q9M91_03230 [Candidatus Dojkabacteria bacterium]|nr:hypothetical protein [Candidatus Dojkabacteria bacterium]MDQ7020836.1 hypothetical protein [Candidatus Dojkabacteria bacterium]